MPAITVTTGTARRWTHIAVPALVLALLIASLALAPPATVVRAAPTVSSCADSGTGSLRDALTNAAAGDTITFTVDCTDGTHGSIQLKSALTVSKNVTIDATAATPPHAVTITIDPTIIIGMTTNIGLFVVNSGISLSLAGITLTGGNTTTNGGAIANNGGTVHLSDTTFTANAAPSGGAIYNNGGAVTMVNTTFAANSATNQGGAIYNTGAGGTVQATGTTFSTNSATNQGGAIYNSGSTVTLSLSVVAGNTVGNSGTGPDLFGSAVSGTGGGNVLGNPMGSSGITNGTNNDKVGTAAIPLNPLLDPLADNGARNGIQTFALQVGSPALDIVTCSAGVTLDARLVPRPQPVGAGSKCDAGSYEAIFSPQSYIVNRFADDAPDAGCNPSPGTCTLRQAMNLSNLTTGPGTNTITFSANGTTVLAIGTTLSTAFGSLIPTRNVTIDATVGARAVTITVPGGGMSYYPLFSVNSGVTLSLSGLTLSGTTNGAISNQGILFATACTFSGDGAQNGGAIENGGTATITASAFTGNTALFSGGALYNVGTMTVIGSAFSGNSVANGGDGGAIENANSLMVSNSSFFGNSADDGGAINHDGGMTTITGSTFSGNSARVIGGAIAIQGSNNPLFTLSLSLVAGNTVAANGFCCPDISGLPGGNTGPVVTDGGGNVVGITDSSIGFTAATDRTGTVAAPLAPFITPLALHGGTVPTFALLPGSPAIDRAPCPGGLTTDARGVSRPQPVGGTCDAGSFEARPFTTSAPTGNGQSASPGAAFASPVGFTVAGAGGDPVIGGQVTFTITPGTGGASATFPAANTATCSRTSATVFVCTIPMSGIVTSPTFTANGTAGGFTIVATVSGAPTTTFTETNGMAPAPQPPTHPAAATSPAGPPPSPRRIPPLPPPRRQARPPPTHTPTATAIGGTPLPQPIRHP